MFHCPSNETVDVSSTVAKLIRHLMCSPHYINVKRTALPRKFIPQYLPGDPRPAFSASKLLPKRMCNLLGIKQEKYLHALPPTDIGPNERMNQSPLGKYLTIILAGTHHKDLGSIIWLNRLAQYTPGTPGKFRQTKKTPYNRINFKATPPLWQHHDQTQQTPEPKPATYRIP